MLVQIWMPGDRSDGGPGVGSSQGGTNSKYRRQQQLRWNPGCMRESSFGIVLVQQYPKVAAAPSGPRGTWSKPLVSVLAQGRRLRGAHLGEEINADRRLVHVVEGIVHESCDQGGLAHC